MLLWTITLQQHAQMQVRLSDAGEGPWPNADTSSLTALGNVADPQRGSAVSAAALSFFGPATDAGIVSSSSAEEAVVAEEPVTSWSELLRCAMIDVPEPPSSGDSFSPTSLARAIGLEPRPPSVIHVQEGQARAMTWMKDSAAEGDPVPAAAALIPSVDTSGGGDNCMETSAPMGSAALPSCRPRSAAVLDAEVHRLRKELAALLTLQQVNALYSRLRKESTSLITGQGEDTQDLPNKRRSQQTQRFGGKETATPRAATTAVAAAVAAAAAASANACSVPKPRYSIGYAGARQTSFHRLLSFLMSDAAVEESLRLTSASSFLDIGSGLGQCVLHAKLVSNARSCVGLEVVAARHQAAVALLQHVRSSASSFPDLYLPDAADQQRQTLQSGLDIQFIQGDIVHSQHRPLLDAASHIYMFDRVFMPDTHALLLPLLCRGPPRPRIMVSCLDACKLQQRWQCEESPVAASHFVRLGQVQLETDGDQSFPVYVYRIVPLGCSSSNIKPA